jgi:2'-5' RNA ligase
MAAPTGITIGVAIAVPEPWGSQLREVRRSFGDADADRMPTHLTLIPPNTIDVFGLPAIHDGLRSAGRAVRPFTIELSGAGSFRPVSDVVFVAVGAGHSECIALESSLREHVSVRPRQFEYHPHVTVAMDVQTTVLDEAEAALADFRATWMVDQFTVYVRGRDGVWHPDRDVLLG